MKIEITQDDIERGEKSSPAFCPIARATQRQFPHKIVRVSTSSFSIRERSSFKLLKRIELPQQVIDFIRDFDNGQIVKPFLMEIDLD